MNETQPPPPPDNSAEQSKPSNSATEPDNSTPSVPGGGCAFVLGVFGGFILFLVAGGLLISVSKSGTVGIVYLFGAGGTAVWLATKPGYRGLSVGIFLGLGAILLLIAICSGKGF